MHGHVSNLNVGVSAAIVLYERLRQQAVKGKGAKPRN
jgi:tRNA G18 (ribose-2'-O)-methylase SpoU